MTAGPVTIVHAPVDLTILTAAEVRTTLLEAVAGSTAVEVDLADVEELDTAGLQVLLLAGREAQAHGIELRCERPSEAVLATLALVGLTTTLISRRSPGES